MSLVQRYDSKYLAMRLVFILATILIVGGWLTPLAFR